MVLGDGSIVTCSAHKHPELFSAIVFSYGTLGFLTAVELDIIPFKQYIKMRHQNISSFAEAQQMIDSECENPTIDSVEAIMYSRDFGVLMTGTFSDTYDQQDGPLNVLGRW